MYVCMHVTNLEEKHVWLHIPITDTIAMVIDFWHFKCIISYNF